MRSENLNSSLLALSLQLLNIIFHARRRGGGGGSRDSNEPPLEVNNGGLKTQNVDCQLLAKSGGMENKL